MTDLPTILIVEDDDHLAEMIVEHLQGALDARILRTRDAAETIQLSLEQPPAVMLVDIFLPDGNGLDLIRLVNPGGDSAILIMTAQPTLGRAVEALRLGARDLFVKPFDLQRLTSVVGAVLGEVQVKAKANQRIERLESLVRKVIGQRRELQQRVDLVCKDLVRAYGDLAEKLVDSK